MKKIDLALERRPFQGKNFTTVIMDNLVILGSPNVALSFMKNMIDEAERIGEKIYFNICTIGIGQAFYEQALEVYGSILVKGTVMENINFGQALEALKQGKVVQRAGWNGKGLSLGLKRGIQAADNVQESVQGVSIDLMDVGDNGITTRLPHIEIYYPDGVHCAWLASQTDMLADDWRIIAPE